MLNYAYTPWKLILSYFIEIKKQYKFMQFFLKLSLDYSSDYAHSHVKTSKYFNNMVHITN